MLITIFTPTYNRAYIIDKLYSSLVEQNCFDFEWLVVDDGSVDNTEQLFADFIQEGKIDIKYVKTSNGGKQAAINKGVGMAKGELFFIVDSDDYLTADAIETIVNKWQKVENKNDLGGLCFRKIEYTTGLIIGGQCSVNEGEFSSLEIAHKLKILGDKAEVFRTDILKNYPFPHFEGENFVPEALIWNRIARKYKLYFVNKGIYMCAYLEDGLSYNFLDNLRKNPRGFKLFYRELFCEYGLPLLPRIKAVIRCAQCMFYARRKR